MNQLLPFIIDILIFFCFVFIVCVAHIQTIGHTGIEIGHSNSWIGNPLVPDFNTVDVDHVGYNANLICIT